MKVLFALLVVSVLIGPVVYFLVRAGLPGFLDGE